MNYSRTGTLTAIALVAALAAQSANAQSCRAEGQVGVTSFHSEGNHKTKVGWGAAAGVDFNLGGGLVAGAEGTYWDSRPENHTVDGAGVADHKMFQEYGIAARLGYLVTPSTLIFGKGGHVRDEQRKRFTPFVGTCGGNACQFPGYYDHYH